MSTILNDDLLTAPMPTRTLPRMQWEASRLTLGGVKWDAHLPETDAVALIRRAVELGVNTFDTAAAYSSGESERRLGLALEDRRDRVFLCTKTTKRDRDSALHDVDASLKRLRTDCIDLYYIHSLEEPEDLNRVLADGSVLTALRECREDGRIRYIGVSGHWYKDSMEQLVQETDLDAILCPVGLFNQAYDYSYFERVVPAARSCGMAVLGMKVFGAGRVKHAASVEPYLRYSLHRDVDSLVIGSDSIAQLEQTVRIIKQNPPDLPESELAELEEEAVKVTQSWDKGEFDWVSHYR